MSLAALRTDPETSCLRNVYRTKPAPGSFAGRGSFVEGGLCSVAEVEVEPGIYDLVATEQYTGIFASVTDYFRPSTDYFYPWLQTGVGWVKVPKAVPNGTIVLTGGVNGCRLVVTDSGADYYFYHDGDSKYLTGAMLTGNIVADVRPSHYDPLGIGNKIFEDALLNSIATQTDPSGDVSYGHFVIAVKLNGRFGMYKAGLMSFNGLTRLPNHIPKVGSFD